MEGMAFSVVPSVCASPYSRTGRVNIWLSSVTMYISSVITPPPNTTANVIATLAIGLVSLGLAVLFFQSVYESFKEVLCRRNGK